MNKIKIKTPWGGITPEVSLFPIILFNNYLWFCLHSSLRKRLHWNKLV